MYKHTISYHGQQQHIYPHLFSFSFSAMHHLYEENKHEGDDGVSRPSMQRLTLRYLCSN
jgi:hypothetical protein